MDALVLAAVIGLPLGIVVILGLVLKGLTARSVRKNVAVPSMEPLPPLPPLPSCDDASTGHDVPGELSPTASFSTDQAPDTRALDCSPASPGEGASSTDGVLTGCDGASTATDAASPGPEAVSPDVPVVEPGSVACPRSAADDGTGDGAELGTDHPLAVAAQQPGDSASSPATQAIRATDAAPARSRSAPRPGPATCPVPAGDPPREPGAATNSPAAGPDVHREGTAAGRPVATSAGRAKPVRASFPPSPVHQPGSAAQLAVAAETMATPVAVPTNRSAVPAPASSIPAEQRAARNPDPASPACAPEHSAVPGPEVASHPERPTGPAIAVPARPAPQVPADGGARPAKKRSVAAATSGTPEPAAPSSASVNADAIAHETNPHVHTSTQASSGGANPSHEPSAQAGTSPSDESGLRAEPRAGIGSDASVETTAPDTASQLTPAGAATPASPEEDTDLMPPASPAMTPESPQTQRPPRTVAPGRGLGRVFAQRGMVDVPTGGPGLPRGQFAPEQAARRAQQSQAGTHPGGAQMGSQKHGHHGGTEDGDTDSGVATHTAPHLSVRTTHPALRVPDGGQHPGVLDSHGEPRDVGSARSDHLGAGGEEPDGSQQLSGAVGLHATDESGHAGAALSSHEAAAVSEEAPAAPSGGGVTGVQHAPETVAVPQPVRTSRHVPAGPPRVVPPSPPTAHQTTRRVPGVAAVRAAQLNTPDTGAVLMVPVGLGGDVWDTSDAATRALPSVVQARPGQQPGLGEVSVSASAAVGAGFVGTGLGRSDPAAAYPASLEGRQPDCGSLDSGVPGVTVQVTSGGMTQPTAIDSVFTGSPLGHSVLEYQEGSGERGANNPDGGATTVAMPICHQTPDDSGLWGGNSHGSVQISRNDPAFRPDLIGAKGWYEEDRKLINPALLQVASHNGANQPRNPTGSPASLSDGTGSQGDEKESLDQLMSDVRAGRAAAPQVAAALKAIAEQLETAPMTLGISMPGGGNGRGGGTNSGSVQTSDWPYDGTPETRPEAFLAALGGADNTISEAERANTRPQRSPRREARNNAGSAAVNAHGSDESCAAAGGEDSAGHVGFGGHKAAPVADAVTVKRARHATFSDVTREETAVASGGQGGVEGAAFDPGYAVPVGDNPADLAARYVTSGAAEEGALPSRRSLRAGRMQAAREPVVAPRTSRRVDIVPRESGAELPRQPDQQLLRRESNTGREHQARRTALKEAQDRRKRLLMEGQS